MFSGCITALVTPFRNGRLHVSGLRKNVRFQLRGGVGGLLVAGSTGETASLSLGEWERAVSVVVEEAGGKVPVMVGAGTNSTAKSIRTVKKAKRLGADAVLVVAPYYVKPTQEGFYRHYRAIAENVDLPVVVYNIPGRSAANIEPATIERLARDCPGIVAVKEASGSLDQASDIVVRSGKRLTLLSGDDSLTLPLLSIGALGVISVVSNIVPQDVAEMVRAYRRGDTAKARAIHLRLFPLIRAMFLETNPIPVKAAMEMLGMAAGEPRLPLCGPTEGSRRELTRALRGYGLKPATTR